MPAIQRAIISWTQSRRIWLVHLGTPCTRWSRARCSSSREPAGGLDAARFTLKVLDACHHANTRFSIENPAASRFWEWEPLKRRLRRARARRIAFPQCAFGTPFKKPTVLWTDCEALGQLERVCTCSGHFERLQGLVKPPGGKWVWKSSLASANPPAFCRAYARAVHAAAPCAAHRADGEDALRSRWEQELAACIGQRVEQPLLAPKCPRRYAVPWAGAQRRWN